MQAIDDEAPKEVPTDENPTLEVVDEPLPEPLQGRHPSIPNSTFAVCIMCLKVKYMHFYVTIWLEFWRKNHCHGVIKIILLPHTCTPWSECMNFFSMDPLFDLAICAMQVCFTLILPKLHISLLEVGSKAKHQCLGEDTYTIERFESTIWGEVWAMFFIA